MNHNHSLVTTVLLLAVNPKGTSPLRLDEEMRQIEEELQRSRQRDRFHLISKMAVRPVDIRRAMLEYRPQIVHFCGHGAGEEGLAFENDIGTVQLVSAEALAHLFGRFATQLDCIVLNACYSEVQAHAISQHINYVIGMKQAIGDQAAIKFAGGFYGTLGAGESFEFAYQIGCSEIQLYGIPEHLTPVIKKKSADFRQTVVGID